MMTDQHVFGSASVCQWSGERGRCDQHTLIMALPERLCVCVCVDVRSQGHGLSPVLTT